MRRRGFRWVHRARKTGERRSFLRGKKTLFLREKRAVNRTFGLDKKITFTLPF
jgi:hypothetical protein